MTNLIHENVKATIKYLENIIPRECNWFIAGGSLVKFNTLSDVDVFFYSEDDFQLADNALKSTSDKVSEYAVSKLVTVTNEKGRNHTLVVQFIKCRYGKPIDVLNTFDINKSCIAYIPFVDEVFTLNCFHRPLELLLNNIRSDSLSRYMKYAISKNCDTHFKIPLTYIIDHYYSLKDEKISFYYNNINVTLSYMKLLENFLKDIHINRIDTINTYKKVLKNNGNNEAKIIEHMTKIVCKNDTNNREILRMSPFEYQVALVTTGEPIFKYLSLAEEIVEKYPEYII